MDGFESFLQFVNNEKGGKVTCAEKLSGSERLATIFNSVFVFYAQLYISPPGYCGVFARLVSPGGGELRCLGVKHLPTQGPPPSY